MFLYHQHTCDSLIYLNKELKFLITYDYEISERDSLTVSALACHAADPGSNPAWGDDFFN